MYILDTPLNSKSSHTAYTSISTVTKDIINNTPADPPDYNKHAKHVTFIQHSDDVSVTFNMT